jgi:hypothetical protein
VDLATSTHSASSANSITGITDTNKLRVNATHDCIRKCQALWCVAPVERVCDDPDLERTLSAYAERFSGTLAIVVTKIDEGISDGLAVALLAKDQHVGNYEETKAAMIGLKDLHKDVKRQLKSPGITRDAKWALREEEDTLLEQLRGEESKKFACLVNARNESIESRLQKDKKQHQVSDAQLPIYFVSNKQYDIYKQAIESEGPKLQIDTTGIPGLRSYALCLAAAGVWKAHEEHLRFKIKVLFHGVHAWASGAPGKRDISLMKCVNDVSGLWRIGLDADIRQMTVRFEGGIIQSLRVAHAASLQGAMCWYETIIVKPIWHNRFLAAYRKDGKNRSADGAINWNESFIESQTSNVLNPAWEEQLPPPDHYLDDAVNELNSVIKNLPDELTRLPSLVPLPLQDFEKILESQIAGIEAAHRTRKMHHQQELANVKLDATLDQHRGYFSQAMQQCYDAGKQDKGKKVCTRIKTLIYDHLVHQDPLSKATALLAAALDSNAALHAGLLDKDVQRILEEISQQFKMILLRENETGKEKEARRQITLFLAGVMEHVDRIERDLAKIRQNYPGM